jgi:hypothetical protein
MWHFIFGFFRDGSCGLWWSCNLSRCHVRPLPRWSSTGQRHISLSGYINRTCLVTILYFREGGNIQLMHAWCEKPRVLLCKIVHVSRSSSSSILLLQSMVWTLESGHGKSKARELNDCSTAYISINPMPLQHHSPSPLQTNLKECSTIKEAERNPLIILSF